MGRKDLRQRGRLYVPEDAGLGPRDSLPWRFRRSESSLLCSPPESGRLAAGVVFIKELVPRFAIAWTARVLYNENYVSLPMNHRWRTLEGGDTEVTYGWSLPGGENRLQVATSGEPAETKPGSCEEFITEHYWGYARQLKGETVEYQVEHPRWRVWAARPVFECDVERLYGRIFANFLAPAPASAFLADGSPVTVYQGTRLALN
jgi:hypothetical protein